MVVTFLPYASFSKSAQALSDKHLGKQRVEAAQILKALTSKINGWSNHPATLSWKGYEDALKVYLAVMIKEWIKRGKRNTMEIPALPKRYVKPWWLGWDAFHYSHQAMLMRKDPRSYQFDGVPAEYFDYGYVWPSKLTRKDKDRPLSEITAPIPVDLVEPIYCPCVTKAGKVCGILVRNRSLGVCGVHRRRAKESDSDSDLTELLLSLE